MESNSVPPVEFNDQESMQPEMNQNQINNVPG